MNDAAKTIRIGTRGSPLALKQAEMVKAALPCEAEICVIKTSGDWTPEEGEKRLATKGLFAKEIEQALLLGEVDIAVHSMKDMESFLPDGLVIRHMLPREDVRDCLLFSNELAENSQFDLSGLTIGTASVRRQAFLMGAYDDLTVVPLRGNVQTRIEKVRAGQVDATLLAMAGLKRLGFADEADVILEVNDMVPAAGQGAVGIEIREDRQDLFETLEPISDPETVLCVSAERAALKVLDGSCHTPIGAYAVLQGDKMTFRLCVASLDGQQMFFERAEQDVGDLSEAKAFGTMLGARMKSAVPEDLLKQVIK